MQIVPLQPVHWEEAAALVAARVRVLRHLLTSLPAQYEEAETIHPLLAELAARTPGVVAQQGGRLVGFLTAMSLSSIKGVRGVFSPEWAHAASGEDAGAIYQALYAALAPAWLANGCYAHALRILADDQVGLKAFYWQGFGLNNVDAIRDLSPLVDGSTRPGGEGSSLAPGAGQLVQIRRATVGDIDVVASLGEGLQRHLAAPPIYLPLRQLESREDHLTWLAQPGHRQWLAWRGDEALAELRVEPTNHTACAVAADPGTVFITSAYTQPQARNGGLAAALLAAAIAALREAGYVRIATDFESANIAGAAFWMRHFQPLACSVIRYVDERAAYAHAGRKPEDFW